MKKALLATSALVMMAGAASAEIELSGSARMGVVYLDPSDPILEDGVFFNSRVRIVFTASGETDTGLSFGASVRHDQDDAPDSGYSNGDNTVFISGAFGKLTMGDVSGAADALVGQVSSVGYGPIDGLNEINFIGTVKTALYYEYSGGGFTFGAGVGQMNVGGDTYNVGVKYATDTYSGALAWERFDDGAGLDFNMISASGSVTFSSVTVKVRVSDTNLVGLDTSYALSLDYTTGPTTITAFYTDYGNNTFANAFPGSQDGIAVGSTETQHYGLGFAYDLGGGATLLGSVVQQNNTGVADASFADLGLKFSF